MNWIIIIKIVNQNYKLTDDEDSSFKIPFFHLLWIASSSACLAALLWAAKLLPQVLLSFVASCNSFWTAFVPVLFYKKK